MHNNEQQSISLRFFLSPKMETAVHWMDALRRDQFSLIMECSRPFTTNGFYLNTARKHKFVFHLSVQHQLFFKFITELNVILFHLLARATCIFVCVPCMEMLYHFYGGKNMISKKQMHLYHLSTCCLLSAVVSGSFQSHHESL